MTKRIIIMGAAGKDFHVFNTTYRGRDDVRVVAFTATQIPNIDDRVYPPVLAGKDYPDGIPIEPEADLERLIKQHEIDEVIFAYSDISRDYVDECRRDVENAGAAFKTFDIEPTMLHSSKPVVAVVAVRTGAGKSPATRKIFSLLRGKGMRVAVIRHPMPYGNLAEQGVQRFATLEDLAAHKCTIEEREEYEPHIAQGAVVYAGVDYAAILAEAEKEADVILWDGGNNDTPHYWPDLYVTVVDPLRPGHEVWYFPGYINLERADTIVISKCDQARPEDMKVVEANIARLNPNATVIHANMAVSVEDPTMIEGKRVLVVEDGPTVTHGGMAYGAGILAARKHNAAEIVDPRPFLRGSIAEMFRKYPDIGPLLPALGYGEEQIADLEAVINACDVDCVVIATPIDLSRIITIEKPHVRVTYELEEIGSPTLEDALEGLTRASRVAEIPT